MAASVQTSSASEARLLRVVSLNVWGLAWPLSRDLTGRIAAIGETLAELNPDLVAFQEVWGEASGRSLIESGHAAGLVHSWNGQQSTGGSGLLVMSRTPLDDARFEPFRTRGLPERVWHGDYWGGKGFGRLRVSTPAGPIELCTTHLHAQYDDARFPEYRAHRMGQAVQLAAALADVTVPIIAAGDFNMHPDSPEHRVMIGLSGLRDAAAEAGTPQPTNLQSNPYNLTQENDERIDYVFVRDGAQHAVRVQRVARIFDTDLQIDGHHAAPSDHAGLLAELEITSAATAKPHRPEADAIASARAALRRGIELAHTRQSADRRVAAAGLGVAGIAFVTRRSEALTRRRLLRRTLGAVAGLGAGSALGLGALAEIAIPREVSDYREIERLLGRFSP